MQRGIAVPTLGLTLVAVLGGCTADSGDEGILVLKNVAAGTGCVVTASETELSISHGSIDLLVPSSYLFIAQMKSRVTALEGQTDQRTIITTGAKIDIEFPNSTVFSDAELAELKSSGLTHFKQLFSAPIKPNGGITDAGFQLIPAALIERVAAKPNVGRYGLEAVATFTVEGDMVGQTVTSQPFTYPVTLGAGISINNVGACPMKGTVRTGYTCNPYQDGVVDCCTDSQGLVCPARTE